MQTNVGSASLGKIPERDPRWFGAYVDGYSIGVGPGLAGNEIWTIPADEVSFDAMQGNPETSNILNKQFAARGEMFVVDLTSRMSQAGIRTIQSVFIDTTDTCGSVQLTIVDSGQRIAIPGGHQGWFPVISSPRMNNFQIKLLVCDAPQLWDNVALTALNANQRYITQLGYAGGVTIYFGRIRMTFVDIQMPASCWPVRGENITVWLDKSSTIAIGGTFQTCINTQNLVGTSRYGFVVHNPVTAVEPLYAGLLHNPGYLGTTGPVSTVNNSINLAPGQTYEEIGLPCWQGDIQVMGATANHVFIAKELR